MSNMLKSFGIVIALSIILFFILKLAGLPNADNAKLALTPFTIIAFVYSKLEEISKAKNPDDKLQSLSDFSLPFWKAYLIGTVTGLALLELVAGFTGVLGSYAASLHQVPLATAIEIIVFTTLPLTFFLMFETGRWVGIRAARNALMTAAFVGASCKLIDVLATLAIDAKDLKKIIGNNTSQLTDIRIGFVVGCFLFGGFCALGAWYGRRKRQSSYLNHLLKSIPPASRTAILDIAYEEAQKSISVPPPPHLQSHPAA